MKAMDFIQTLDALNGTMMVYIDKLNEDPLNKLVDEKLIDVVHEFSYEDYVLIRINSKGKINLEIWEYNQE